MTTKKQIAANRRNAQLSTGPRTPEGKARSSRNALKHGLSAETLTLPGENAEELETFHDAVTRICQPRDAIEESIIRQFVMADWRGRRLVRVETGAFWERRNAARKHYCIVGFKPGEIKPETPAEEHTLMLGSAGASLAGPSGVLTSLARYDASIRRSYFQSLQVLEPMRQRQSAAGQPSGEQPPVEPAAQDSVGETSAEAPTGERIEGSGRPQIPVSQNEAISGQHHLKSTG